MQPKSSLVSVLSLCILASILFSAALIPNSLFGASHTKGAKLVDVNSADVATLQTLPGITHTLATRIVNGRPYKNVGDLKKVEGMTSSKINGIKTDITFGAASTAKTSKTKSSKSSKKTTEPEVVDEQTSTPAKQKPS